MRSTTTHRHNHTQTCTYQSFCQRHVLPFSDSRQRDSSRQPITHTYSMLSWVSHLIGTQMQSSSLHFIHPSHKQLNPVIVTASKCFVSVFKSTCTQACKHTLI